MQVENVGVTVTYEKPSGFKVRGKLALWYIGLFRILARKDRCANFNGATTLKMKQRGSMKRISKHIIPISSLLLPKSRDEISLKGVGL